VEADLTPWLRPGANRLRLAPEGVDGAAVVRVEPEPAAAATRPRP
jgi:hypothetical protein